MKSHHSKASSNAKTTKLLKHGVIALSLGITTLGLTACNNNNTKDSVMQNETPAQNQATQSVVALAQSKPELSILVEAVQAAGLANTLSDNSKKYTVFAPSNAAFAQLLKDKNLTKEQLINNTALLTKVLTYHVIGSEVKKADIPVKKPIFPLQGNAFSIDVVDGKPMITDANGNTANITQTDIMGSNGVVHLIDKVILPAEKNLVEVAIANPEFSILVEAVQAAGLVDTLKDTQNLTVFAPTNAAFAALLTELNLTKEALLQNTDLLKKVLTYHVVPAKVYSNNIPSSAKSLQGEALSLKDGKITDQRERIANIVKTDVQATNGVIHVIDKVILPKA